MHPCSPAICPVDAIVCDRQQITPRGLSCLQRYPEMMPLSLSVSLPGPHSAAQSAREVQCELVVSDMRMWSRDAG